MQSLQAVCPNLDWNLPAGQFVHASAPGLELIVPGLHDVGEVEPGRHEVPAGHVTQPTSALTPVALELVPPGHDAGVGLPTMQYEPSGHSVGMTVAFPQKAPSGQRPEHCGPF